LMVAGPLSSMSLVGGQLSNHFSASEQAYHSTG
jgi:hypothetical protein